MMSQKMDSPVSTRTMASPTETETPMDRLSFMALPEIAPSVSSSTCRISTYTAGSASTMK